MSKLVALLTFVLVALSAAPSHADQVADIKARGTLICGIFATNEPFGFQDVATRQIVGYDADMCHRMAKALGVKSELKSISLEARIPELLQSRVDVLTAVLGFTKQRAEQVAFSDTYFVSTQKIMVRADSGLKTLKDLEGKKISANQGSSSETAAKRAIPSATLVTFQDGSSSFLALRQGKVDGFASAELVEVPLRNANTGMQFTIIDEPIATESWGIGVRKTEPGMLAFVNQTLAEMEKSGEAGELFNHWFGPSTAYKLKREFKFVPIPGNT